MKYVDNYPNGTKSGYSAADDPDRRDYSPLGVASQQRNALHDSYERERQMDEYQRGVDSERARLEKIQAEREREEWIRENQERERRKRVDLRWEAIDIIVQQKRDEYNKKSWFGKAIATLRGKTFYKMRDQITDAAERTVDSMTPEEIKEFVKMEREGRTR